LDGEKAAAAHAGRNGNEYTLRIDLSLVADRVSIEMHQYLKCRAESAVLHGFETVVHLHTVCS
jgi:hypothetical protein